jgi:hypothetical protein
MNKLSTPGKAKVRLEQAKPSRIRREPVASKQDSRLIHNAWWDSREWEIRLAVIGIIFFALAINAVIFDIGELLSK